MRKLLKAARLNAGLSQVKLSRLLGKYANFVCKYETGERRLDVVEFNWIASKLDLDPALAVREIGASYGDDAAAPDLATPLGDKDKRKEVRDSRRAR